MMILPNSSASSSTVGMPPPMKNNFAATNPLPHLQQQQNPTSSPWLITAQEHQANEGQFMALRPMNGLIGGEQARPFFLKSGLPAITLAQIWQLADLNKDGKLDRFEFSVAMKLVRNCLAGIPLPPTLPDSMRQISGGGGGQFPIGGPSMGQFNGGGPPAYSTPMAQPQMPPRPMSTYGTMPAMSSHGYRPLPYGGSFSAAQTPTMAPGGGTLPFQMGIKELGDWTLPQPLKLRFCQQFNQLDRSRVGLLTGQQARGVLGESQLPTQVLAQIWTMSDVNKDGCLSIEEFCTAQFLIEMVKSGYALPSKLPNELNAFCHRSRTVSPSTVAPATPADPNAPPPQKGGVGNIRTFEDKRKDNLDKGQAELDRRRQILREEEERRRAEIERREREEAERRERERMELERRREVELEAERQRELERDRERTLEEQRMKVQREEARRRLEMERIRELEKIRVRDLENQLQAETEKTTQIQQRQRTMAFQLQALDERSQQLNTDISGSRDRILEITQEIEGMREQRDEKCARIQAAERQCKELTIQSERFSHENLQLQTECQRQLSRTHEIEALRKELTEIDAEIQRIEEEEGTVAGRAESQEKLVAEKRPDWEKSGEQLRTVETEHAELLERYNKKRLEIHPETAAPPPPAAAFVQQQQPPPQYEMPPADTMFGGSTAQQLSSREESQQSQPTSGGGGGGFGDDFRPNFNSAFVGNGGGAGTAAAGPHKQKSIDEGGRARSEGAEDGGSRRKSESASIGSVASIAAKLQQQMQLQHQQRQASLSREGSVASAGGGRPAAGGSMSALPENNAQPVSAGALKTARYRALYEFNARSGDELSLQPGDVVLVFEGHQSEPGWLAGQIRDKVGWFPAAFAEPIGAADSSSAVAPQPSSSSTTAAASTPSTALKKAGSLTGSPSGEPLAAIQEEGELFPTANTTQKQQHHPFVADFTAAFTKSVSLTDTTSASAAAAALPTNGGNNSNSMAAAPAMTASKSAGQFGVQPAAAGALYDLPPVGGNELQQQQQKVPMPSMQMPPTANAAAATAPPLPLYEMPPMETTGEDTAAATVLGTGVALYQWKARNDQEMSFARGDVIEVLEQGEMRWRGRLQKNRQIEGWFPKSYIKLGAAATPATAAVEANGGGAAATAKGGQQQQQGERRGSGLGEQPKLTAKQPFADGIGTMAAGGGDKGGGAAGDWFIALYQFDAVEPTDLSLKPGDRILVTDQKDQWWRGSTSEGRSGIFPANYVQRASEVGGGGAATNTNDTGHAAERHVIGRALAAFEATASNQISLRTGDTVRVHQMTQGGWWEGEVERDGQKLLGWFPGNYIQVLQPGTHQSGGGGSDKLLAVAAFDYQAQHDDELSFKGGDLIEVVERSDGQWWKGRKCSGATGSSGEPTAADGGATGPALLFPANFVQLR